jgi:predicted transcriptional regulator
MGLDRGALYKKAPEQIILIGIFINIQYSYIFMIQEVKDIGKLRKRLGLTQTELAKRAGVSQSLIAKIESGVLDPSFSVVKKIEMALEQAREDHIYAKDIMQSPVMTIALSRSIASVIRLIKKHGYSQIPVKDDGIIIGLITERCLLDASADSTIADIMEDAPPTIASTAPLDVILDMLHHFPIVLVSDRGKVQGVITKTDVIAARRD